MYAILLSMNTYSIGMFAKRVGRSVNTIQRWDRTGKLVANRHPSGHRYYTDAHFDQVFGVKPTEKRRVVGYCRVSSQAQKPDLVNQQAALELFAAARGFDTIEWVQEIGGGLNFKRTKFLALMDAIGRKEVGHLCLAHKDRLVRFGFDWFSHYCEMHGCELHILNHENLSPQQEMIQDMLTIVHCFSSRLYGLRKYKKVLAADDSFTQNTPQSDT